MVGADRSVYDQFWNEGVERELVAVNGGAKRDHLGGVRRDRLAAAGLSP